MRRGGAVIAAAAGMFLCGLQGCSGYAVDRGLVSAMGSGSYAAARVSADAALATGRDLDRPMHEMKAVVAALADGVPAAAVAPAESLYQTLRTAGINEGKTTAAFLTTEDSARVYKGEPYEQAMSFCYVGILDGVAGDWGNLRAAVNDSLFTLRDFTAQRDRSEEQKQGSVKTAAEAGDPNVVGVPVPSDFALGYALKAIAARQLHERDEVREAAAQLRQVSPRLSGLADIIENGEYNTVFVVDFGLGPEKVAVGGDRSELVFRNQTPSTPDELAVTSGEDTGAFPIVCDLNVLARESKWTNLAALRKAKSGIGTALLIAGGTSAVVGSHNRSDAAVYAGLGALVAGGILKATSYADTRQVEIMPQRVYVVLLNLPAGSARVEFAVNRFPESRVVLPAVPAGDAEKARLHYVRLPNRGGAWASSGRVVYGNDAARADAGLGANVPWIIGGRDVRTPSDAALDDYHRAGVLQSVFSVSDLEQLYRDEGITLIAQRPKDQFVGTHILEGGTWLFTPGAGSAGFARLYGQVHAAYVARSARVKELARLAREAGVVGPVAVGEGSVGTGEQGGAKTRGVRRRVGR